MIKAQMMWVKHQDMLLYQEGDLVWLEGRNLQTNQPAAKLAARRHGPFPIRKVLSPVTYQLILPATWKLHPVFHTDLLTPYRETPFHGRNYERPPPDLIADQEEYEVEKVLDMRHYGRKRTQQYLVKWKGYPDSDNEWVSQEDMSADEAIREYEEGLRDKRESGRAKRRIRHLMSSSPVSVTSSPPTPTHNQLLSSLVGNELSEARALFPTPPPGQLSPDSSQSLDLAPTTGIRSTSIEDDGKEVGGGTAPPSEGKDRDPMTVLLVRNPDQDEEEGKGSGGVQCEAAQSDPCRFHTPFTVQRCDTHGERHERCGELLQNCECHIQPLRAPPRRLIIPDISNVLRQLRDSSEATLVEPTPHDLGRFEGPSQDTLVEADGTIAPQNEETTAGGGQGQGGRGRARGAQRGARRAGSPEVHRIVHSAPVIRRPASFEDNMPPNFSPMKVHHQGRLHPTRFIKYRMYDEPMVWGTMGEGYAVYEQPAHVAPRLRPNETEPYSHADTFILLSKYPGASWVNAALVDEEDGGLWAEVHRYRKLMEEVDAVEQKISALQDRMVDISLTLHASMRRLAEAEAVKRIEDRRARTVQRTLVHPWIVERGRST